MRVRGPLLATGLIALALVVSAPRLAAQPAGGAWAIAGGTVLDGRGAPLPAGVVVGSGERITCVGTATACPVPSGAQVLDATAGGSFPA